LVRETGLEPA